jgi:methylase of polypeptide subunit release factors
VGRLKDSAKTRIVALNEASRSKSLIELGGLLRASGYAFTTITPLSHQRVYARRPPGEPTLRDVFGWSHSFHEGDLPPAVFDALMQADAAERVGDKFRSRVRFSTLGDQIFVHSAFPTKEPDAVFFGPDTYRFARAIRSSVDQSDFAGKPRILDVGAGTGAGGLYAARILNHLAPQIVLADINERALDFSRVNAALNRIHDVSVIYSDLYAKLDGSFDLIISNPPYLVDAHARTYRHGGGEFGSELSLRILKEGLRHLSRGGLLVLYTGTAVVRGVDLFQEAVLSQLKNENVKLVYKEIDPDVFGEELEAPPYDRADRIAVVSVVLRKSRS